jgi:ubiquinol-cytochrome c reductase iron-sulfur subunit
MAESAGVSRRHFLTVATAVVGGLGAVAAAVPFVASFRPSARAQALGAPVEVDISKLEPGAMLRVEWRGRPIWVLHRTERMLNVVREPNPRLADPDSHESRQPEYAQNEYRAARPQFLVLEGVCTHLGCAPLTRFEIGPADLGPDWRGGFFCPCHGSAFDLSGRVYAGVPARTNLSVPPYRFIGEGTILIGSDTGSA